MNLRNVFVISISILIASTVYARWFQDKQYFDTGSFGQVVFSHDIHLEALGSNCEYCHNKVFNMVTKKNPTYTMADMKKGKSCGACHNGNRAFSVDDCMSCHSGDLTWKKDSLETKFSHSVHLGMDYTCDACHPDLFKAKKGAQKMTMSVMEKGEYCGACHDGDTAFSVKGDCGSCHTVGDIAWQKGSLETKFSHSVHLGMDYTCDACHPDLFKAKKGGQKMTMDQMYAGEYCGACHDGDTAFSVKGDCGSCHTVGDIAWQKGSLETKFSHSVHIGMDYKCSECHPDLFKAKKGGQKMTMDQMYAGEYCGACHDGDTAFSAKKECASCHTVGDFSWQSGALETKFSHSYHIGMDLQCGECHPDLFKPKKGGQKMTMDAMYNGEYCGACHDGDTAFSVKKDCLSCHSEPKDIVWKKENIGETKFSHSIHLGMDYGCGECHPVLFKAKKGGQKMTMADMEKGQYCGACHDGNTAFSVKGDCNTCHASAVDITWEKDNIGKTVFSHSVHLGMDYSCSDCHPDFFKPKKGGQLMTMALMDKGQFCGACHDGDTAFSVKGDCGTCHTGAVEISWKKDNIGETKFSHSLHLGMDYSCGDCHPDLFKPKKGGQKLTMAAMDNGEYCGACHDGDSAFSVKGDCATCHAGNVTWENKAIGDTVFSHKVHLEMGYFCDECHPDLFKPKHKGQEILMRTMAKGEYCGACHDGDTAFSVKRDCDTCHIKK